MCIVFTFFSNNQNFKLPTLHILFTDLKSVVLYWHINMMHISHEKEINTKLQPPKPSKKNIGSSMKISFENQEFLKKMPPALVECIKSSQMTQSIAVWKANEPEMYSLARSEGWIGKCFAHIDLNVEITNELKFCLSYSAFFTYLSEWCSKHPESFDLAKENGWLELCSGHMLSSRGYDYNAKKVKTIDVDDYCSKLISGFASAKNSQLSAQQ